MASSRGNKKRRSKAAADKKNADKSRASKQHSDPISSRSLNLNSISSSEPSPESSPEPNPSENGSNTVDTSEVGAGDSQVNLVASSASKEALESSDIREEDALKGNKVINDVGKDVDHKELKNGFQDVSPQTESLTARAAAVDLRHQFPEEECTGKNIKPILSGSRSYTESSSGLITPVDQIISRTDGSSHSEKDTDSQKSGDYSTLKEEASGVPSVSKASSKPSVSTETCNVPNIPQRSFARAIEPENIVMLEAKRATLGFAKPVLLTVNSLDDKTENKNVDENTGSSESKLDMGEAHGDDSGSDFDPDMYFNGPEDEIVTVTPNDLIDPKPTSSSENSVPAVAEFDFDNTATIRRVPNWKAEENELSSPLASPTGSVPHSPQNAPTSDVFGESPEKFDYARWTRSSALNENSPANSQQGKDFSPSVLRSSAIASSLGNVSLSSPNASPRPYKYEQSPILHEKNPNFKPEPPIFGVCVVGFHHQRGPEVEYWVGREDSSSDMWPYLPFQSLPDGSHQFEENICYFTLLYDHNKSASTSLTFSRDEDGHIKAGTSDFRDVSTLFAIACSRQLPVSELELEDDQKEYTRSIVQKSVVVIATKPIFGVIKEKLTVVTRSFFEQRNFGDKSIIDHFYENMVQMPMWFNENDLQVGMNLQRCIYDFGPRVLVILKAMLLESKILFYAQDTDVLGTTQFALISLIPNLIDHLDDCGSPLLSSYELGIRRQAKIISSDRQSLLKFMGFPLQLFAGGGLFAPFVPLQQFEDLRKPETRYGIMGTTNNLFLGEEIDFDLIVNIDSNEVDIRNQNLAPLLKLTDADKAWSSNVVSAVKQAWDDEEQWQPQSLGYMGGEDYIRHEFEEYLIALLASVKCSRIQTESGTLGSKETSDIDPVPEPSSANPVTTPKLDTSAWGSSWIRKWQLSNNFRIFDKQTDPNMYRLASMSHPGLKMIKPSGIERIWGLFKKSSDNATSSQASVSSAPQTPSLQSDEKFEFTTPTQQGQDINVEHNQQTTPRSWFWKRD